MDKILNWLICKISKEWEAHHIFGSDRCLNVRCSRDYLCIYPSSSFYLFIFLYIYNPNTTTTKNKSQMLAFLSICSSWWFFDLCIRKQICFKMFILLKKIPRRKARFLWKNNYKWRGDKSKFHFICIFVSSFFLFWEILSFRTIFPWWKGE